MEGSQKQMTCMFNCWCLKSVKQNPGCARLSMKKMRMKRKCYRRGAHGNARMLDQNWGRLSITQSIWILAVDPAFASHWIHTPSEEEKETVLLPDLWISTPSPPPPTNSVCLCLQTWRLHVGISAVEGISATIHLGVL